MIYLVHPELMNFKEKKIYDSFINACKKGNLDEIKDLYKEKPDLDLSYNNQAPFFLLVAMVIFVWQSGCIK